MFMRDALYAGKYPLTNPTIAATVKERAIVGRVTFISKGTPSATKRRVKAWIRGTAATTPRAPPITASPTASPTNKESRRCRVKPNVFSTATSRVRPRTDIAMVFADTRRIVKTTAPRTSGWGVWGGAAALPPIVNQWAQQDLNLRLRPCEGRTLPLSYAPDLEPRCGTTAQRRQRQGNGAPSLFRQFCSACLWAS